MRRSAQRRSSSRTAVFSSSSLEEVQDNRNHQFWSRRSQLSQPSPLLSSAYGHSDDSTAAALAALPYRRRSIQFSSVEVYYHDIVIGDNPGSLNGPTIALGWEQLDFAVFAPSEFEALRRQRPRDELVLTRKDRERMLQDAGYSKSTIKQACAELQGDSVHPRYHDKRSGHHKLAIFKRLFSK